MTELGGRRPSTRDNWIIVAGSSGLADRRSAINISSGLVGLIIVQLLVRPNRSLCELPTDARRRSTTKQDMKLIVLSTRVKRI